jgi:hypothetical protein
MSVRLTKPTPSDDVAMLSRPAVVHNLTGHAPAVGGAVRSVPASLHVPAGMKR